MYREAYITYEVINKPKIHEVLAARKAPPTGGRGDHKQVTIKDSYAEESKVGADLARYKGVLGFWDPRWMCVFKICIVDTDVASYDWRHSHKIASRHDRYKKGKYLYS